MNVFGRNDFYITAEGDGTSVGSRSGLPVLLLGSGLSHRTCFVSDNLASFPTPPLA